MTQIGHYDQGDVWVPQATFTVGGTPTDPTTLILRIKKPDGTVSVITENTPATPTLPIVRVSAGVFKHSGITLDDAGYWFVRFEGTGAAVAAEEHQAIVDPSEFYESAQLGTRALVGLAETKDWLQYQQIDTENDLEIARVINDISDRFHYESGREFKVDGTNPLTRSFDITSATAKLRSIPIGDLATATTVEILDTDWSTILETIASSDYTLQPLVRKTWEPVRRIELGRDVRSIRPGMRLRITGNFGFPAVPGNVRQAVLDCVVWALDRDVENYQQDLGAPTTGGTVIFASKPVMLPLPPTALAVARSYADPLAA